MKTKKILLGFFTLITASQVCFADPRYFMCGGDEDGCDPNQPLGCLCMPYDDDTANKPYCLNLDAGVCAPITTEQPCHGDMTLPTQSSCLATLYQSEPEPPCPIETRGFCESHQIPICQKDGNVSTCH